MIEVFGSKPINSIYLPDVPYGVRNDCQLGRWKVGDGDIKGTEIEVSIIKVSRYFGSLGKAKDKFWRQIWFIPAPSCKTLPSNTVCVTYLKTRSINQFAAKIAELMEFGNPAEGIFIGGFEKHSNDLGNYYSVNWKWRERESLDEKQQLEVLSAFMNTQPLLLDSDATQDMVCVDGIDVQELLLLVESAKAGAVGRMLGEG